MNKQDYFKLLYIDNISFDYNDIDQYHFAINTVDISKYEIILGIKDKIFKTTIDENNNNFNGILKKYPNILKKFLEDNKKNKLSSFLEIYFDTNLELTIMLNDGIKIDFEGSIKNNNYNQNNNIIDKEQQYDDNNDDDDDNDDFKGRIENINYNQNNNINQNYNIADKEEQHYVNDDDYMFYLTTNINDKTNLNIKEKYDKIHNKLNNSIYSTIQNNTTKIKYLRNNLLTNFIIEYNKNYIYINGLIFDKKNGSFKDIKNIKNTASLNFQRNYNNSKYSYYDINCSNEIVKNLYEKYNIFPPTNTNTENKRVYFNIYNIKRFFKVPVIETLNERYYVVLFQKHLIIYYKELSHLSKIEGRIYF